MLKLHMHAYVRNTQITKTVIEKQVHEKEEGEKNRNIDMMMLKTTRKRY